MEGVSFVVLLACWGKPISLVNLQCKLSHSVMESVGVHLVNKKEKLCLSGKVTKEATLILLAHLTI